MQTDDSNSPAMTTVAPPQAHVRSRQAVWSTVAILVIGALLLCFKSDPFIAGLYFVPFAFGPLLVTLGLAFALRSRLAQYLLMVSSVLYGLWFAFIYAQAFYINPDPQSPIALVAVGIYAIPILAIFWVAAGVAHWRRQN